MSIAATLGEIYRLARNSVKAINNYCEALHRAPLYNDGIDFFISNAHARVARE